MQHYYNSVGISVLMNASKPELGLTNMTVTAKQGNLICSFMRDNINSNPRYFNTYYGVSPHILIAYGSGSISFHQESKYVTQEGISLNNANFVKFKFINNILFLIFILFVLN